MLAKTFSCYNVDILYGKFTRNIFTKFLCISGDTFTLAFMDLFNLMTFPCFSWHSSGKINLKYFLLPVFLFVFYLFITVKNSSTKVKTFFSYNFFNMQRIILHTKYINSENQGGRWVCFLNFPKEKGSDFLTKRS